MNKLRKILNLLQVRNSFMKSVLTLLSGTAFSQALIIIASPLLSRIYSPDDFGISAIFASVSTFFTAIVCWSYDRAIVIADQEEDAANLAIGSVLITVFMSMIGLLFAIIFQDLMVMWYDAPALSVWLYLTPISVFAAGLFKTLNFWYTRRQKFGTLALRQIVQSSASVGIQAGYGAVYSGPGGLILGPLIGQIIALSRMVKQLFEEDKSYFPKRVTAASLRHTLARYKKFPLFYSWSELFNVASNLLPVILIGYFFDPIVAGLYAFGYRLVTLPMGVLGNSIGQVFLSRITASNAEGRLDELVLHVFNQLFRLGLTPILLLTIAAPELFQMFFGNDWITSGEYIQYLSIWMLLVFVTSPISAVFEVLEKQKQYLVLNVLIFTVRFAALLIGGLSGEVKLTIVLYGGTGAVLYAFTLLWVFVAAKIELRQPIRLVAQNLLFTLPFVSLPAVIKAVDGTQLVLIATVALAMSAFLLKSISLIKVRR